MFGTTGLFVKIVFALALVATGLVVVGLGQVFEAVREIALNTRAMAYGANPAAAPREGYAGLAFIATAMLVAGALLGAVGLVGFFVAI